MRSRNIPLTTAERMIYSAHNYWLVLVGDVVGAIVFLVFGIRHLSGLAGLERAHRIHHERHTVNYGVTTTLWDRLLGTFQPSHESGNDRSVEEVVRSPALDARGSRRHHVHHSRRPGHPDLRAAPPTGHIHGRRQAANSADGSMVR